MLMILSTNLKTYSEEDLKCFAEAIHRLDTLSKPDFLQQLKLNYPKIDNDVISDLANLHETVSTLYSGLWYKALSEKSIVIKKCFLISAQLLTKLGEQYVEPIQYSENNMNVNW